jgi:hypothetical protein
VEAKVELAEMLQALQRPRTLAVVAEVQAELVLLHQAQGALV